MNHNMCVIMDSFNFKAAISPFYILISMKLMYPLLLPCKKGLSLVDYHAF